MSRLISRQEAARLLDVRPQTVTNWVTNGLIKGHMVNKCLMVDRDTIEQYFDNLQDLARLQKSVSEKTELLRQEDNKLDEEIEDVMEGRKILPEGPHAVYRWITDYATMSAYGLFTEQQRFVYHEMINMGHVEYVSKKLGIKRKKVVDIFFKCLRIISETIDLQKSREKWEKMEQENRQLKFLTTTLRQEIDALKNSKGSNPVEIKSEEVLMKDKLNTPIIDLNFTVRAFRVLSSSGCKTLGDVANLHKNTLLNMPHCGQKTIKDIEDVLEIHGLSLMNTES